MNARVTLALACLSLGATEALSENGDHLYPSSVLRSKDEDAFRIPLARMLFDHGERQVVMTMLPSFGRVRTVYVAELAHPDGTIRRRVFAREAYEEGWHPKKRLATKAEAPIDDATFLILHELWTTALKDARPENLSIPFDGVWYLFEDRELSGYAFSPTAGTKAAALAEIGHALFQYAWTNESKRSGTLAALRQMAKTTRVQFGLPSVPATQSLPQRQPQPQPLTLTP